MPTIITTNAIIITDPVPTFGVGDTLVMHSPHTGLDTDVQYRGRLGDDALVIFGGYQMTVPFDWLRPVPAKVGPVPLARGVPVVDSSGRRGNVAIVLRGALKVGGEACSVLWDDAGDQPDLHTLYDSVSLHVDLDDMQGFGYALRLADAVLDDEQSEWLFAVWCGDRVAAADRLMLARALLHHLVTP